MEDINKHFIDLTTLLKGRKSCKRGHELVADNVILSNRKYPTCKQCNYESSRKAALRIRLAKLDNGF